MDKETPTVKTIKLIPNSPWQPLYTQYTYMDPRYDSTKRQNQPPTFSALKNNVTPSKQEEIVDYGTLPEVTIKSNPVQQTPININDLVKQTIQGKFGNGAACKAALGANYAAVQALINKQLAGKRITPKVNIPKIEQKYIVIEPGHEPPTEPIDIPQYFIDKHFELTNTPLTGAEIAAIRMDPFNLQTMPEEEIDMIIEESPEEKELARAEHKEQRKENRAQRKEARKQRRLSRRSKNNKTE